MQPVVPELVLAFRTVCYEPVERNGNISMSRRHAALVRVVDDEMVCHAGLRDLVVEMLQRLGYELRDFGRDEDSRLRPLGEPAALEAPMAPPFDEVFLQLVQFRERGLVKYDKGKTSPARLIAQVALAYRNSRMICAMTRVDDTFRFRRELARWIKDEFIAVLNHRYRPDSEARIVVGTYTHLGGAEADLHNCDYLFAIDPLEMLVNTDGKYTIRNADSSRLFGFLPRDKKLTVLERDRCTSLFGHHHLILPRHGQAERPIDVIMLPIRGRVPLPPNADIRDVLRAGVWSHPVRNRRTARLADALASANDDVLHTVTNHPRALQLMRGCGGRRRVCVLCGTIEQALELCSRLRGWRLVTGKTVRITGLSREVIQMLRFARRQPSRPGNGVIVTEAGLSRIRQCDVIIRADAGITEIPTHWAKNTNVGVFLPPPALMIDFFDRHHPELRQRSKQRRRAYLNAGWRLPAEFPSLLDQFFAALPQLEIERC